MITFRLFLLSPLGQLMLRWTVLLAFAWMANALMSWSHPRRRLILWRGVLVLGCLLPLWSVIPIRVYQIDAETVLAHDLALQNSPAPSAVDIQSTTIAPDAPAAPRTAEDVLKSGVTLIAFVWILGSAAGAIRLLRLQLRLSRLRRDARDADSELRDLARNVQARLYIRRTVTVKVSDEVTSPFVCGLLHPTVMLPAELVRTLAPAEIPAILSHEMAHLRSHDLAWCVAWHWMKTVCWLHPFLWKAPMAHKLACEQEADRIASDQWTDRSAYTRLLAQLTLRVIKLPAVETTMALNGTSQIVKRLALLRREGFCGWKWKDSIMGFGMVAGLALATAGWGFSTARAENSAEETMQRLAEQERPRTVVPFDPKQFDRYVGFYQLLPNIFVTVTRQGEHFFAQLTGQIKTELYPESPNKFFATVVAAQISFATNAEGNATELILHQAGIEQHAPKIAKTVIEKGEAALAERIKNHTPDRDREAPLRRYIDALIKGQPNLDDMAPDLVAAVNRQWPTIQKNFQGAGALKSFAFKQVDSQGLDLYTATFANKEMDFLIGPLTSDHKMQWLVFMQ